MVLPGSWMDLLPNQGPRSWLRMSTCNLSQKPEPFSQNLWAYPSCPLYFCDMPTFSYRLTLILRYHPCVSSSVKTVITAGVYQCVSLSVCVICADAFVCAFLCVCECVCKLWDWGVTYGGLVEYCSLSQIACSEFHVLLHWNCLFSVFLFVSCPRICCWDLSGWWWPFFSLVHCSMQD